METDQEFKDLLEKTRGALLAKVDKLKEVLDGAGDWFDETGSLGVENEVKGAIRDLEKQILDIDTNLVELADSQHEREQKGTRESKPESDGSSHTENNEQCEQALMGHGEELKKEFERDCAKEWNRRNLAREYTTVDGEGFGRDEIYRVDRFGCMEMYVGEFDDDPPVSPPAWKTGSTTLGRGPPADLVKRAT